MLAGSSASKGTAMNIKIRTNLVSGILFLIFSIVLLIIIPKEIQQTYQQNQYISAKAIPQLIGIFMLAVSVYLIIQSIVLLAMKILTIVQMISPNRAITISEPKRERSFLVKYP